jgi:SAM-dependent methyltransferase
VVDELGAGSFDRVLAHGLLHHLPDDEVVEFFELARHALGPGGHLVTLDGCFVDGQSRAARFLLEQDRGRFVRDEASYVALAKRVFPDVRADIRHDLYRIPYTLILLECGS